MWSGTVLYPIYAAGRAYWGISPLADQSTAGVVMMVEGTFLALGLLAWVFFEVSREGIEKQRLLDLADERGVELDEARAQRAVAAGHGRAARAAADRGPGGTARPRPPERLLLAALVFVVGASSLGVEIAAARLLAPYFGASTIVWANTIGVVLVALSVGYWFGGRYADRHPHLRGLCLLVLAAAVLIALVPFAARPFLGFSVDAFDTVSVGGFAGSLFGVLSWSPCR